MLDRQAKPIFVIKRAEDNKYADFLSSDTEKAYNWTWVDEILNARWLATEMLPRAFAKKMDERGKPYKVNRLAKMIVAVPDPGIWDNIEYETAVFELVRVLPGWEPLR
jgi:hypothetical protein